MHGEVKFQIGKNGVTPEVIEALKNIFKNYKVVRISTLKSSGRDRESIKLMAQEISDKLSEGKYPYRIIGFTIIMKRRLGINKKNSTQ